MVFVMLFSASTNAQCDAPVNLAASYNNNVSTFSWDAVPGAVDYVIEIKQTFDPWTAAEIIATVPGTSVSYTGFFHSAQLDWRVSANCGSTVSNYTVAQYNVPCPQPDGLTVTNLTANGATLNWVPAAGYNTFVSDFVVAYRLANTTNAWTQIGHTSGSSINVTGLLPNTSYEWCVNQSCIYSNSNPVISQFTTGLPPCTAPAGLAFTYSNNVSTFNWNAVPGATEYRIQIGWAGANWGTTEVTVTSNTYSITNLMQGGDFQFRVRANCGSGFSNYTSLLFSTPCSAPGNLTTTNITTTSATLNWVPAIGNNGNTVFAVAYRLANTTNAWTQLGTTTASFINVTGLTPGTVYEWCVNKVCSGSNSNPVFAQFTTTSTNGCGTPTGLAAGSITNSSAVISWNAVPGAGSYNLQFKGASSNTWSTFGNTSGTSVNLSNLSLNTSYQIKVRSKCGNSYGAFSPISSFTTLNCVSNGINNSEWIDLFSIGSVNRVSGADAGGYVNTGLNATLVIGSSGNAGQISAGFAGSVRQQNFCVYIDFNRNGSFNDAGERVAGASLINSAGNFNFYFSIPATVTPGTTSMRVVMRNKNNGFVYPCLTGFLGETEDYIVNLVSSSRNVISDAVSVNDDKTETGIVISPNPSDGIFTITLPKNIQPGYSEIVNISGVVVQQQSIINAKMFSIDISRMPKGLYLLRITDQSGRKIIRKLVKS